MCWMDGRRGSLGVAGPMGVQLDSLADVVTGGVAPAMVAMRLFQDDGRYRDDVGDAGVLGCGGGGGVSVGAFQCAAGSGEGGTDFEGMPAPAAGVFWMGVMLAWGELQGSMEALMAVGLAWIGLVVVPLAMVSRRKMWGLKGWGKEPGVDRWRAVLVGAIPLWLVGRGLGGEVCSLLCRCVYFCTSVWPWQRRRRANRIEIHLLRIHCT